MNIYSTEAATAQNSSESEKNDQQEFRNFHSTQESRAREYTTTDRGGIYPMSFLEGRRVNTGVPIVDELFGNNSPASEQWVFVSRKQLIRNARFFDNDPNVITGFNFRMDALLNGGIIFSRKRKEMSSSMKEFMTKEFTSFLRQLVRNWWYAGFCAVVWHEHSKFIGRPDCLDLTQVVVQRERSIFHGETKYRYFYQPHNTYKAELEIKNVMTFSWESPDQHGNLRSMVQLLQRDQVYEDMLTYYSLVAMKGRAMPTMITQKDKETYDHDNIQAPTARAYEEINGRSDEMDESQNIFQLVQQTEVFFSHNQPTMTDVFAENVASLQAIPHFSSTFHLAEGRKFTAAPHPEAPTELLTFRVARQERAYALMGVPLAMVSNSSSTSNSKLQTQNTNSFVLFDNSQQSLKLELLQVAKQMFYAIHLHTFVQEYNENTPQKDRNPMDEANACEVVVEMPSVSAIQISSHILQIHEYNTYSAISLTCLCRSLMKTSWWSITMQVG